ncbi:MAG: calcium-binding protein, partial [Pseudomonadota bacterium]
MSVFFGSDYVTRIDDLVFTPSSGQFGPDNPGFFYDEFFGVGEDDPIGGPFSVGGDVIVDVPFKGDVELFTARLYGEVGAKFGLNVSASLDPGSIDALLPYETVVAYPDIDLAMVGDGDVIDIFFGNTFTPEADANSGFTTEFPSITFQLDVIAELQARLAAELGAFGGDPIDFEVFDFTAETAIPIISLDTNRQITAEDIDPGDEDVLTVGDANPLEVLGVTTPELVEELVEAYPDITATENSDGEFNGLSLPLNTFVSAPAAEEEPPADVEKEGDEQPDEEEPDLSGIDLGSMSIFIPNINAVSGGYDGNVFVVDPTQKAQYNRDGGGNLTGIDRLPDSDGEPNSAGDGKAQNIAELVLDLDGLVTYSTGGLFPPLELGSSSSGSFGPAYYDADFYFNLFDAELLAELPLVQEFSLT